jgi:hypothetical protein
VTAIANETKPTLEEFLSHHGVKGQKWGVRKMHPTGSQIRGARRRQHAREDKISTATTPKAKSAAKRAFDTHEDRVTAAHMTTGEKIVIGLLGGPVGLVVVARSGKAPRRQAQKTDQARSS